MNIDTDTLVLTIVISLITRQPFLQLCLADNKTRGPRKQRLVLITSNTKQNTS